ncbi:D-ribose pyranase [Bifidobacterium mongoliense]|uniref:D-ribose pyranase n=1 Tax=Bifidobacterium mongoliense TaxID=518643 RepID=UPI002648F7CF|nr:D-ribose pyranase [Bifidobacterium mongoliense]MDN6025152.1 D-ribose pyranase [Bifidobacterium mongoliense]MDN6051394.1 D-ribose pyranase [Bifidobacterium mongoliense]MDN6720012.1 D-ribose pyranase [Bifidobacterium mongoliense]
MLTHGILNAHLAAALAGLRHKDRFVISDCGLPVPPGVEVIDLALTFGVPRFEQVLDALNPELVLEAGVMAKEARGGVAETWVRDRFDVPLDFVDHDGDGGFKDLVHGTKFVVRTGETTSYANVIFRCGVPF